MECKKARAHSEKIVPADSLQKDEEKEFYRYEFLNRRGHKGIHFYKDSEGKLTSSFITRIVRGWRIKRSQTATFSGISNKDKPLEQEIAEIQASEEAHTRYACLSGLMTLNLKKNLSAFQERWRKCRALPRDVVLYCLIFPSLMVAYT